MTIMHSQTFLFASFDQYAIGAALFIVGGILLGGLYASGSFKKMRKRTMHGCAHRQGWFS
jgi:hypothetical protein